VKSTLGEELGREGLKRIGKKAWRQTIAQVVPALMNAFVADYVVLGGGNAKEVKELPAGAHRGNNLTAFRGGFRLWHVEAATTLSADGSLSSPATAPSEWRFV
jgi:hypothetical protein